MSKHTIDDLRAMMFETLQALKDKEKLRPEGGNTR